VIAFGGLAPLPYLYSVLEYFKGITRRSLDNSKQFQNVDQGRGELSRTGRLKLSHRVTAGMTTAMFQASTRSFAIALQDVAALMGHDTTRRSDLQQP
jgi:hypothetical protein